MKNYLSLHLQGKQLLKYWIPTYILFVVFIAVYAIYTYKLSESFTGIGSGLLVLLAALSFIVVVYIFYYYVIKLTTDGMEYKEDHLESHYTFSNFLATLLGGLLLSVVTLGIYFPWFIQHLYSFFIDGSSYRGNRFTFKADGLTLFGILTLLVIIPSIAITLIITGFYGPESLMESIVSNSYSLISLPILYTLVIKWMVDGEFNGYKIKLNAKVFPMIGYLFMHLILAIITVGIYFPMFYLRIYKYTLQHVGCTNDAGESITLDYDIEPASDFLFMWGQLLLVIVTVGFYTPWAYSKVMKRILGKTSLA